MKQSPRRKAPSTAFKPGQSGNPRGRPRLPEDIKALLRELHRPAVIRLAQLLSSEDERVALRAAEIIIERNMGKAPQAVEVSGADGAALSIRIDLSEK